ncbi:hypothetical protein [Corynebacterium sp. H130]|uniref:hypothetical protein n=1 Tax=Corynebacterium sp. H130 TaxID=3133444 RepID=UPI0030B4F301
MTSIVIIVRSNTPISAQRLRDKLINSAVALASVPHPVDVTLRRVADMHGVHINEVRQIFPDDRALIDAAKAYLRQMFVDFMPAPNAEGFDEALTEVIIHFAKFSTANAQICRAMCNLFALSPDITDTHANPVYETLNALILREAPGVSEWVRVTRSLAILSALHGYAHLCTAGVLRHLSTPVKDHLAVALASHIVAGIGDSLHSGCGLVIEPHHIVGPLDLSPVPSAKSFPRANCEEAKMALFRGAVEIAINRGVDMVTFDDAAAQAGLTMERARCLVTPDEPLHLQLERYMNSLVAGAIRKQMNEAAGSSSLLAQGKANSLGYVAFALTDPVGLDVFTEVCSGSIITTNFASGNSHFEQDEAFEILVKLVRDLIVEGGGPQEAWALYESTLVLWCVCHGLAHGVSGGPMHRLPLKVKIDIAGPVMDLNLEGFIKRLELDLPGAVREEIVRR